VFAGNFPEFKKLAKRDKKQGNKNGKDDG